MQHNRQSPYRIQYSFGGPTTPTVRILLIVTAAVFVIQVILREVFGFNLESLFGVVPFYFRHRFYLWQPFTYLFLHAGLLHLGLNLLVLWMFGCELERVWGRRFFLKYYFLCGVGAGICIGLFTPIRPVIPTIGASGALYGMLLAYGLLFPNRQILFMFFIPMKAKHFVILIGALAFYSSLTQPGSGISHMAHLSGLLIGYLYLRGWGHFRNLHQRYLEWKLKRLKKKYRVIDGNRDKDEPPYIH